MNHSPASAAAPGSTADARPPVGQARPVAPPAVDGTAVVPWSPGRWRSAVVSVQGEDGMATAEYAIATVAAAAFAGLLIAIIRSEEIREALAGIIRSALSL